MNLKLTKTQRKALRGMMFKKSEYRDLNRARTLILREFAKDISHAKSDYELAKKGQDRALELALEWRARIFERKKADLKVFFREMFLELGFEKLRETEENKSN